MDKKTVMAELTAEQKEKLAALDAVFSDPANQEKLKGMTSIDDVFAFYEENGFRFSDAEKKEIARFSEKMAESCADGELTEAELAEVAGGWGWKGFWGGLIGGAAAGAGGVAAIVGWALFGCGVGADGVAAIVGGLKRL